MFYLVYVLICQYDVNMYSMCFSSMSGVFFKGPAFQHSGRVGGLRRSPAEVAEALGGKYRGKAEVGGGSVWTVGGFQSMDVPWMYP